MVSTRRLGSLARLLDTLDMAESVTYLDLWRMRVRLVRVVM
jgi:hypothetical protein